MGTVLFTWELGGGLGHLMRLAPLAEALHQRGHRVFAAVRDLSRAQSVLGNQATELLQAPVKVSLPANPFHPPRTFAHILHNIGYGNPGELSGLGNGWRNILRLVCPDVVVFDHSPTALLASRGLALRRVVIGHGFFCVPDQSPLLNLRSWEQVDPAKLKRDEDATLDRINQLLERWHQPPLERIGQLYSEVDDTFLTTFRELDYYSKRSQNLRYRAGYWPEFSDLYYFFDKMRLNSHRTHP